MTHDYTRHGTTTLFAALDVLEGKVIGRCMQRHRHQEFIRFLNAIEAQVPARKFVHVISRKQLRRPQASEGASRRLNRHPRFAFHFTPTSLLVAQRSRGVPRQTRQAAPLRARCLLDVWSISKPPSTASSRRPTAIPNPSPGLQIQTKIIAAVRRGHQC